MDGGLDGGLNRLSRRGSKVKIKTIIVGNWSRNWIFLDCLDFSSNEIVAVIDDVLGLGVTRRLGKGYLFLGLGFY